MNHAIPFSSRLRRQASAFVAAFLVVFLAGCAAELRQEEQATVQGGRGSPDRFLPVDCLLPPQVRKLGSQMTYLAPRRPIKTTAEDCEIRGGEYVAYDRADYRTALRVWLEQAMQGDPEAQTYVGEIYEKGLGLPADYEAARLWYSRAAEQGYSRAQINLGYLYEKGLGVKQDMVEALNWYRRASGIEDDDLDYSSAIEVKAASLAEEQTAVLRAEVERREREIQRLTAEAEALQARLRERESGLQAARAEMAKLQREMRERRDDAERLAALEAAWKEQQRRVAEAQAAVDAMQAQMARMQSRVARQSGNLATQRQMLAMRDLPGPAIEVFDPVIVITRGEGPVVKVGMETSQRSIRGRITAPAGLSRASLNGQPLSVDAEGIFTASVPVTAPTRVTITAEDRRQRSARFSFLMEPVSRVARRSASLSRVGARVDRASFGRYYALVIGNNDYAEFPTLTTAVNDARRVAEVLRGRYGFETRLLVDADRYAILSALDELRQRLGENDNLLIYYAGHGERDAETLQGYWLPVDAEQDNTANWIANSTISDLLNTFKARHVLVVADSCYSGAMTRSSVARIDAELDDTHLQKWLKVMARTPSRTVLTSGGVSPVLDSGGGEHSLFARAFLQELEQGDGVLDAYRIYLGVSRQVREQAASVGFVQSPTYAPIRHTGHGGGEFLFVKV